MEFADGIESALAAAKFGNDSLICVDATVLELYGSRLRESLGGRPVFSMTPTEAFKSLDGVGQLAGWLVQQQASKTTSLVAIGGGITQDVAAFVSHVYHRGIRWSFVPTTLLAMCDSCIGAKSGVNLNGFKNQLGMFHAPQRVVIATEFTKTLSDDHIKSGYGEILKLMLTGSREHFARLARDVEAGGLRNPELGRLIRDSLLVKRGVIEIDEYETDLRRILNYGHTFGHALEAVTEHQVPHGIAVAWGLDLINYLSLRMGLLTESDFRVVHDFVIRHLTTTIRCRVSAAELVAAARRDKKATGDAVNLVLFGGPGDLRIVKTRLDQQLTDQIARYLDEFDVLRGT
ncbi:MAG: iron-containing alcohol dehydrogenase [Pirellulaceae bacterium]|nr:iron-containing alcohol dehydrogenase [Pirellulaceae bacterium]